jgi:FkbM family methyltransferase
MDNVGQSGARNREFDEKFTRELLIRSLIPKDTAQPVVLDIGGHKGESIGFLRKVFPAALIHSFEPAPEAFAELRLLENERTHCHNVAVTDVDGPIVFYGNAVSHTNSVFRVNTDSRDSLFFTKQRGAGHAVPEQMFNRRIEVSSVRLASFCKRHAIQHVDLMKLDVQGAERKVLDGAEGLLQATDNIVLEIMLFDYYEHQSSFLEIESALHPAGFRLFSISDISNNPMNGRTDWVEAVYRRWPPP